jgi:uncharacterized protein
MMPQGPEQQQPAPQRAETGHLDLSRIAQDLQIKKVQVEAVVQLLDEENTIPFITRYRKERTGGLDEEVLRIIQERVQQLRALADRKQTILRTIESQGKLTDELRSLILAAENPKRLEDLYLPYKPKKRSLAQAARERGLDRLAMAIWENDEAVFNLEEVLPTLLNPEQQLNTTEDVLGGAGHILSELIAECADVRAFVRGVLWDTGRLQTTKSEKLAEGQGLEYKDYFAFAELIRQMPPHRILAINRGEKDNALTSKIEWDEQRGRFGVLERLPLPKKPVAVTDQPADQNAPPPGRHRHPPFVSRMPDLEAHPHRAFIEHCVEDALARLLVPSLEREIRKELTQRAEHHAVGVFARNLRSKLLAAPLRGKRLLAIDPALKTGCKLAVLDEVGTPLADAVVYPHAPQNRKAEAKVRLEELIRVYGCSVIAIGNGTACRETEELVSELIADIEHRRNNPEVAQETPAQEPPAPTPVVQETPAEPAPAPVEAPAQSAEQPAPAVEGATVEGATVEGATVEATPAPAPVAPPVKVRTPPPVPKLPPNLPPAPADLAYVIVNEAGASVYSASPVGREEFPNLDATLRGTISIGRRLQDPLSELVKIEPQHVGVGLYQHDMKNQYLNESLAGVIESCVNAVGIDLNTASVPLLRHVSGMNALTAQNIVTHRNASGPFRTREQLMQVDGIGPVRFTQAAGFLKILGGDEPLDGTWIHPESYDVAKRLLGELEMTPSDLADREKVAQLQEKLNTLNLNEVATRLGVGVPTLKDIFDALARPGRDPREDLPPPVFKKGILKLEDLQANMELKGTVLNVVDFGAFIDIGLKDSGLVHISQMANRYVKSPYEVVAVGDVVTVWVLQVDGQRNRVSLTMIAPGTERRPPERRPPQRQGGQREGQGEREGGQAGQGEQRPPRGNRGGPREGQAQGEFRGQRGEGQGDRPQREGAGAGRQGGGRPRGEGGGQGGGGGGRQGGGQPRGNERGFAQQGKRSTLPPRGTSKLGGGGRGGQQKPQDRPQQEAQQQPADGQQPAEGQQTQQTPAQKKPQQPKKPQTPKLSQGGLSGKTPLSSFSELADLLAMRNKKEEPKPEGENPQEQPPQS